MKTPTKLPLVSSILWEDIYQEVLKNPLNGTVLSRYTSSEIKKNDTYLGIVKDKKGKVKIIGMMIKNSKDFETNKELIDDNGNFVKEATGLFAISQEDLPSSLREKILEEVNIVISEPSSWGKKDEPNFILSILQHHIFEMIPDGTIKGSNFGSFLNEQYSKMGKEVLNKGGYDFNYDFLEEEAKSSYIAFLQSKLPYFLNKKYNFSSVNSEDISFDIISKRVKYKDTFIDNSIMDDFHKTFLQYYETIVKRDSVVFKKFNKTIDVVLRNNTSFTSKEIMQQILNLTPLEMKDLKKSISNNQPSKVSNTFIK